MIKLIVVGKVKDPSLNKLIGDFSARLSSYERLKLIEVSAYNNSKQAADLSRAVETERILKQIKPNDYVVLLDLKGRHLSSEKLSAKVKQWQTAGKQLCFIIGGSYGVGDELRRRSNYLWKLSDLTFTHQFARLLLYEQLYRSFAIQQNHPYHK